MLSQVRLFVSLVVSFAVLMKSWNCKYRQVNRACDVDIEGAGLDGRAALISSGRVAGVAGINYV